MLGATSLQLFSNLPMRPINPASNQLTNVVQLTRELGAVCGGVDWDVGLADPGAWGSQFWIVCSEVSG